MLLLQFRHIRLALFFILAAFFSHAISAVTPADDGAPSIPRLEEANSWKDLFDPTQLQLRLRPRYENNAKQNRLKTAEAATLRTLLGIQSRRLHVFDLRFEGIDVSALNYYTYNSTRNGVRDRQIISDPRNLALNRGHLGVLIHPKSYIRLGRQLMSLDNQRFIGSVPFRQNYQVYDAASWYTKWSDTSDLFLAWVGTVKSVTLEKIPSRDLFVNNKNKISTHLTLIDYLYLIDQPFELTQRTNSTATIGLRAEGNVPLASAKAVWIAEAANQQNYGSNPLSISAFYYLLSLGLEQEYFSLQVAEEVLSGTRNRIENLAFRTPLATKHIFQGWADLFLITPYEGIEDTYLQLNLKSTWIPKLSALVAAHSFRAQAGNQAFGYEIDAMLERSINEHLRAKIEYAHFNTRFASRYPNTRISWFTLYWNG